MALPGNKNNISLFCPSDSTKDGQFPVFLDMMVGTGACQDLVDNSSRIFASRVVIRNNDLIGQLRCHTAEQRPLALVTLSSAPEYASQFCIAR